MNDPAQLAFQVMVAGHTLAGLTLVFLGNISNSFEGYDTDAQDSVRQGFRFRVWTAFLSMIFAIGSGVFGLFYGFHCSIFFIYFGVAFLLLSVVGVFILAFLTTLRI